MSKTLYLKLWHPQVYHHIILCLKPETYIAIAPRSSHQCHYFFWLPTHVSKAKLTIHYPNVWNPGNKPQPDSINCTELLLAIWRAWKTVQIFGLAPFISLPLASPSSYKLLKGTCNKIKSVSHTCICWTNN